jgi:hypothetical protein
VDHRDYESPTGATAKLVLEFQCTHLGSLSESHQRMNLSTNFCCTDLDLACIQNPRIPCCLAGIFARNSRSDHIVTDDWGGQLRDRYC